MKHSHTQLYTSFGLILRRLCALWAVACFAQTPALAQLYYDARGTGLTTGVIAKVRVYNPTTRPMRVLLGHCFIPGLAGYQGYVVPEVYPLEVQPFEVAEIGIEGYCTHVSLPPVPEGGPMPEVSQWVSWASALPLPEAGQSLSPPYSLVPPIEGDPLALTYPGTQTAMPYVLDFNQYPQYGARWLLHAAYSASLAFDRLLQEGKISLVAWGGSPQALKQALVQQYVWAYGARLGGKGYAKEHFRVQLIEEAEHQMNQPAADFSPDVQQQLERYAQDVWANISLVGATAKLIPPSTTAPPETLRAESIGPATDVAPVLRARLQTVLPTQPDAIEQLTPVQIFLQQQREMPEYQPLVPVSLEKWRTALWHLANRIDPQSPTALRDVLIAIGIVESPASSTLSNDERQQLLSVLHIKANSSLEHAIAALHPEQPDFLARWRALKAIADHSWYERCCRRTHPLQRLPAPTEAVRAASPFRPQSLPLTGHQWKSVAPLPHAATTPTRKFPWWIVGIPVIGGGTYWLINTSRGKEPAVPALPVANNDAVSISCGSQTTINPLENDTGAGISLTSVSAAGGISAVIVGSAVGIAATSVGTSTAQYTIADSLGRTASAIITITVTDQTPPQISCPPSAEVPCGQQYDLTITGQATANDACAGPVAPAYSDNPPTFSGCKGVITRTWTATDPSNNKTSCVQTISVNDTELPFFTFTPADITVALGQQNDLGITGLATAADACSPPVIAPTFNDRVVLK